MNAQPAPQYSITTCATCCANILPLARLVLSQRKAKRTTYSTSNPLITQTQHFVQAGRSLRNRTTRRMQRNFQTNYKNARQ